MTGTVRTVEAGGTKLIKSDLLESPSTIHGFSTRVGGASSGPYSSLNLSFSVGDDPAAVEANRRRFVRAVAGDVKDAVLPELVTANQVHGARVAVVGRAQGGSCPHPGDADALVTAEPGILVAVQVADCVPVLLHDPKRGVVAAVHAGWRGTKAKVAAVAADLMMREFGCRPQDIVAVIGPSIGPCCYEVDRPVRAAFLEEYPGSEAFFAENGSDRWKLDLWGLNSQALQEMGLSGENVQGSGYCTLCNQTLFFSHRGSGGRTGRLGAAIGLTRVGE